MSDYSLIPYCDKMAKGEVDGYFLLGQNPAAGASNGRLVRQGLRSLKWLVCCDWFETESAMFWKDDPTAPPTETIGTEVFFIPAASAPAKEGTLTNTERLIQWHDKAIDPDGDCRSDAWFIYNLGKKLRELYKDSIDPRDAPLLNMTWDYDYDEPPRLPDGTLSRIEGEPDVAKVLKEINGYHVGVTDPKTGKPKLLSGFSDCKDDGTTSCGCWIYSGIFPEHDHNRARDRKRTDTPVQLEWAYAWPHNRRIMYNRASAEPDGTPWSERKKYLWWDAETAEMDGPRRAGLRAGQAADLPPERRQQGHGRHRRRGAVHYEAGRQGVAVCSRRHEGRPVPGALRAGGIADSQPAVSASSRTIRRCAISRGR